MLPGLEPRLSAFAENVALQSLPDRFPDFLGFMRSDQGRLGADAVILAMVLRPLRVRPNFFCNRDNSLLRSLPLGIATAFSKPDLPASV